MLKKYMFLHNFLNLGPIWISKNLSFKNEEVKNNIFCSEQNKQLVTSQSNDLKSTSKNNQELIPFSINNSIIGDITECFCLKENIEENLLININIHTIYQITKRFSGENLLWITLSPKIANVKNAINKTKYSNLLKNIIQSISIKSNVWKVLDNENIFVNTLNELIKNNNIATVILLSKDILKVIKINKNINLKIITLQHPCTLIINPKLKYQVWEKLYLYY